jgi:hypothetical protein
MERMKVAHFTVAANVEQSARWKQAAECAGHRSVGTWLAEAADLHMKARARAGVPLALSWHHGRFRVVMEDGAETEKTGWVSAPFGIFRGNGGGGREYEGSKAYSLVYLPERRILATFRHVGKCRQLASELAPTLLRGLSPGDPGGIVERYRREPA